MLQVGDRMPEFTLRDNERKEVTQEALKGTVSVVAFYPMAFTGGCTLEMRAFQGMYPQIQELGAKVIAVSADTYAAQGAFARENGIEFPLLSDWPAKKTIEAFGVQREGAETAMRYTFVFDEDGVVRQVIDDPRDMNAHPAGALAAVQSLTKANAQS